MKSVSLLPSQPVLNLKMYLISFILYLFNFMYIYVLAVQLLPSSQNNLRVGNSLFTMVLFFAFLIISRFRDLLTRFFHLA